MEVLESFLLDVLEFHKNALEVFARPGKSQASHHRDVLRSASRLTSCSTAWKEVFASAWKTFRIRFTPILASLKRQSDLLLDLRMTAAVIEIQDGREATDRRLEHQDQQSEARHKQLLSEAETKYRELSRRIDESREEATQRATKRQETEIIAIKTSLAEKLAAPDYESEYQEAVKRRAESPTSGAWILDDPAFLEWSQGRTSSTRVLYLHGKPGAGKSVITSRIIGHLRARAVSTNRSPVLFFYFRHGDETKTSMASMLRALLVQLLYQDDSLSEYLHQRCSSNSPSELRSVAKLQEVFLDALRSQRSCFILLDGLDECGCDGQTSIDIVGWLLNRAIPACHKEGGKLHLWISGQRDGVLDQQLLSVPSLNLDTALEHKKDIRSFAGSAVPKIIERFSQTRETATSVVERVATASDGRHPASVPRAGYH